jgi:hypothetical protein
MKDAWDEINDLKRRLNELETLEQGAGWVYLSLPLTSTSWDGDSYSTTAKTLIDLSTVFGAPAGIKAIDVYVDVRDSGSSGASCWVILAPTNAGGQGKVTRCGGLPDDYHHSESHVVPCDSNGDIYYQCQASGASTLDIVVEIWGYYI